MQAAWNSSNLLLSLETNFHITCQIHKKIIKNAKNFFTPRINGSMIDGCKFPMPAKNLYGRRRKGLNRLFVGQVLLIVGMYAAEKGLRHPTASFWSIPTKSWAA